MELYVHFPLLIKKYVRNSSTTSTTAATTNGSHNSNNFNNYIYSMKGKVKFALGTGHRGTEREHDSSLFLMSALDGGGWLTPHLGHFTPGKETKYSFYRSLDGP
jgi:hypothetical protein